jgi:hypothetical protein
MMPNAIIATVIPVRSLLLFMVLKAREKTSPLCMIDPLLETLAEISASEQYAIYSRLKV